MAPAAACAVVHGAVLYRAGGASDHEHLAPVLTRPTRWELIAQKLSAKQAKELRRMHDSGDHTITDLAETSSSHVRQRLSPRLLGVGPVERR